MPKVIIAIPTYNRKEYLSDCVKSALNQSFKDFEVIVFDNHSDYDIGGFLKTFNDPRLKLMRNESNLGNKGNFQKIFKHKFDSEYLVVFHDDDAMRPDFLAKNIEILEKNKQLALVASEANFVKQDSKMGEFFPMIGHNDFKILPNAADLTRRILADFNLCYDSAVYRTEKIEDITPFFEKFDKWNDRPYLIHLAQKNPVSILFEKLVNYRIHQSQDSQVAGEDLRRETDASISLFEFYKENLPAPISKEDADLFYGFTTNNIISFASYRSDNFSEFIKIVSEFRNKGLFNVSAISARGVYYFIKAILKFITI